MLSIKPMGKNRRPDYYLSMVAAGDQDYYLGSGETPGRWAGSASATFEQEGEVAADDLFAVLAGQDPRTGEQRTRAATENRKRTPGFDFTFSAPKSVSLLYGLAPQPMVGDVVAAHEAAVDAALGYLERHATFTRRRGVDGQMEFHPGEGLVVAAFRHRTSREGDPQLHTHCLVANLTKSLDGRWGTLDSRSLYHHGRTAGFVYQAVLRAELSRRLGVEWGRVRRGYAEIDGFSPEVRTEFSTRRAQVLSYLDQRGLSSAASAQAATLKTRRAKTVPGPGLRDRWQEVAAHFGYGPRVVASLTGHPAPLLDARVAEVAAERLISPRGLTRSDASFDRRAVVRGLCEALPPGSPVTLDLLDGLTDDFLARCDVVVLTAIGSRPDLRQFSTEEMLATEWRVLEGAMARRDAGAGVVAPGTVDAVLCDHPELSGEQQAMVRRLTTSGHGVDVVLGVAGSGKTHALGAAREAWQAAGYRVAGLCLAARAAAELEAGAGIASTTVAQFLLDAQHAEPVLASGQVVVVDEAGMVDTRRLGAVLEVAEAVGAKVVLAGDYRQLPEVEAGGAFRGLVKCLGAVELSENRRQVHGWERDALLDLRQGEVEAAVAAYRDRDRIWIADTGDEARAAMVAAWAASREEERRTLMVAVRNRDVTDLNRRARSLLVEHGEVAARGLTVRWRTFAKGDEVLCLRNDRRIGVLNSTVGRVVDVDADAGTVTMALGPGRGEVVLPAWYLERGHVTHAYATTAHKAQGMTVDQTFVLAGEDLYREAGYVSLSRGAERNELYAVGDPDDDDELERHGPEGVGREDDPIERIVAALERSETKELASSLAGLEIE